jgi:hypothetical protein
VAKIGADILRLFAAMHFYPRNPWLKTKTGKETVKSW